MYKNDNIVFISYARENRDTAERLYMDLRENEINVWLDIKCLKAGSNWKYEIQSTIRRAKYFILLISNYSVSKQGYVQKEIREALDVLSEHPRNKIFIIPVRLDDAMPIDLELLDLNWVEIYPDYHNGLAKILSSLIDLLPYPLMNGYNDNSEVRVVETKINKMMNNGKELVNSIPMMIGERTPINYTPFRTIEEFFQQFIDRLPKETKFADNSISHYITVSTKHPDVFIGDDLLKKYPEEIILVLQHSYLN